MMTPKKWGGWAALGWLLAGLAYLAWGEPVAIPVGIVALFFTFGMLACSVNGGRE